MKIKNVHLGSAKCALDIGDGSERGEYVCQDYMINVLGRPHRMVNIMYTYYPKDKEWPQRSSVACKDMDVSFAWDYPYDDYFPFNDEGKQFEEMKDIRKHGQDVLLTLTVDCSLDDEELRKVARKLRTFGRMCIRINHECHGDWFTHNQRFSYDEIADFFVRFAKIIKEEAPHVRTIFCAGLLEKREDGSFKIEKEESMLKAYEVADIWSADKYLALHYGWPYDIAEAGDVNGRFYAASVSDIYKTYSDTYERLTSLFEAKPFIQAEFNSDGDVTGAFKQGDSVLRYYNMVKENGVISGISMYQFRDRGRLGLEIEDPNNSSVGIKQPIMDDYKKILNDDYFMPEIKSSDEVSFPTTLRWGGSEDADGISVEVDFEKTPEFCEITLEEEISVMMEFNGKWFYKGVGVATIDLMPAFYEKPLDGAKTISINIFATPSDGENHDDGQHDDWAINYYTKISKEPSLRIRYEVPGVVG